MQTLHVQKINFTFQTSPSNKRFRPTISVRKFPILFGIQNLRFKNDKQSPLVEICIARKQIFKFFSSLNLEFLIFIYIDQNRNTFVTKVLLKKVICWKQ